MEDKIKGIVAILGTWLTWLFGAWDIALSVLCLFIIVDYITGVAKGFVTKELSSDIGLKGIIRKSSIFLVLIVAVSLDRLLSNDVWVFRTITCFFFIGNEGISLFENVAALGVPIPTKLLDALKQLREGDK